MRLKRVKKQTCFLVGAAGCAVLAARGLMMLLHTGAATMLQAAGYVLVGGMLLFLCATARGAKNRTKRFKLLGLFALWLLSYFTLPPVSGLAGALVVPLLLCMYRGSGDVPWLLGLALAEAVYYVVELRNIVYLDVSSEGIAYGEGYPLVLMGALLLVVALARAIVLLRLYRRAAAEPTPSDEHTLQ